MNFDENAGLLFPYVPLQDGRVACVYPLTYGRARIGVSKENDRTGFVDEF